MGSLDTLAPDQRAVLDLVLQRGRSYDDIARLLAIDRAAVRARALAAFDQLGPDAGIAPESRALIADYLLGQLPERVAEQTRARLASVPSERAWADVLASELASIAGKPLPEIPHGSLAFGTNGLAGATGSAGGTASADAAGGTASADATGGNGATGVAGPPTATGSAEPGPPPRPDRPSSRRGGAILLGAGALVVAAVVVLLIVVLSGGSSKRSATAAVSGASPAGASSAATTSSTTPQAQLVAQTNLNPPSGAGSAKGVGFVVKDGSAYGIIIQAQHVPPNHHNAYAAWLYNSPRDAYRLGFVNPGVGKNGQLRTGGVLPTGAGRFRLLLLTLETQTNPKSPGPIVLGGPFTGVPAGG